MDPAYKAGTVVRLRSGGPNMTVEKVLTLDGEDNRWRACAWFDNDGCLKRDKFNVDSIILPGS